MKVSNLFGKRNISGNIVSSEWNFKERTATSQIPMTFISLEFQSILVNSKDNSHLLATASLATTTWLRLQPVTNPQFVTGMFAKQGGEEKPPAERRA